MSLLAPIQEEFQSSPEWQEVEKKAYPAPPTEEKKKKKPKDKGSRHPGAAGANKPVEARPDGSVQGEEQLEVSLGKGPQEAMEKLRLGEEKVQS